MPSIHFLDVTNRDGVQTARTGLSKFGKVMVNFYLGRLGVAQSEIGFPFLFHEVPYVRACLALAEAGAFGDLRLSGWCRAVPADVEAAVSVRAGEAGLRHYNLSISTSDQMIARKFRGKLDRAAIIDQMVAAVTVAKRGLRTWPEVRKTSVVPGARELVPEARKTSVVPEARKTSTASGSTRRTGRGPTTATCWSSRSRPRRPGRRGCGTATPSAGTPPGASGGRLPARPRRARDCGRRQHGGPGVLPGAVVRVRHGKAADGRRAPADRRVSAAAGAALPRAAGTGRLSLPPRSRPPGTLPNRAKEQSWARGNKTATARRQPGPEGPRVHDQPGGRGSGSGVRVEHDDVPSAGFSREGVGGDAGGRADRRPGRGPGLGQRDAAYRDGWNRDRQLAPGPGQ